MIYLLILLLVARSLCLLLQKFSYYFTNILQIFALLVFFSMTIRKSLCVEVYILGSMIGLALLIDKIYSTLKIKIIFWRLKYIKC